MVEAPRFELGSCRPSSHSCLGETPLAADYSPILGPKTLVKIIVVGGMGGDRTHDTLTRGGFAVLRLTTQSTIPYLVWGARPPFHRSLSLPESLRVFIRSRRAEGCTAPPRSAPVLGDRVCGRAFRTRWGLWPPSRLFALLGRRSRQMRLVPTLTGFYAPSSPGHDGRLLVFPLFRSLTDHFGRRCCAL